MPTLSSADLLDCNSAEDSHDGYDTSFPWTQSALLSNDTVSNYDDDIIERCSLDGVQQDPFPMPCYHDALDIVDEIICTFC